MINQNKQEMLDAYSIAGLFTLSLRMVVGWTYFSAFWRRLVLENKLIPDAPGYIGEKFNHFLPNAFGIKPMIEYLVSTPDVLWWAMVIFTIIEGIVGLLIMLGFFTRLMSIGVFSLATGILLGSGWLGYWEPLRVSRSSCQEVGNTHSITCYFVRYMRYATGHGLCG